MASNGPRFSFYEKVTVRTDDPAKEDIDGALAAILGQAQRESGDWYYAVHIYRTGMCRYCYEHELSPTGEYDKRETFYDGTSISVRVDEQGKGNLAKPAFPPIEGKSESD